MKLDEIDKSMGMYVLDGENYHPATTQEWSEFMNPEGKEPLYRSVAYDQYIVDKLEYCSLSTVFLGLDHNFGISDRSSPVLFESMIFGGEHLDESMDRYCTYEEARVGHGLFRARITKVIERRLKTVKSSVVVKGKHTTFEYTSEVKTYQALDKDALRMIREN